MNMRMSQAGELLASAAAVPSRVRVGLLHATVVPVRMQSSCDVGPSGQFPRAHSSSSAAETYTLNQTPMTRT